jgi:hypothetical protein
MSVAAALFVKYGPNIRKYVVAILDRLDVWIGCTAREKNAGGGMPPASSEETRRQTRGR